MNNNNWFANDLELWIMNDEGLYNAIYKEIVTMVKDGKEQNAEGFIEFTFTMGSGRHYHPDGQIVSTSFIDYRKVAESLIETAIEEVRSEWNEEVDNSFENSYQHMRKSYLDRMFDLYPDYDNAIYEIKNEIEEAQDKAMNFLSAMFGENSTTFYDILADL